MNKTTWMMIINPHPYPTLPHLLNNKYCHYVKEEQNLNLNVYMFI